MALLILQVLFMGQAKCKLYKCKNHTSLEYIITTSMQLLWMWIFFIIVPPLSQKIISEVCLPKGREILNGSRRQAGKSYKVGGSHSSCLKFRYGAGAV